MEDSVEKNAEQPGPKVPVETVEMVRQTGTDKLIQRIRGKGGKFVRQPKAMPNGREFTRVTRNYMLQMEAGKDGKLTKGSQTKYQMMVENMICISRGVTTVLPNGDTIAREPKQDSASAQAFKILTERGLGKPSNSDEDREDLKTHGVKVIILQHPEMMDKTVTEEKPREKLIPAFAEVTEITTNPK